MARYKKSYKKKYYRRRSFKSRKVSRKIKRMKKKVFRDAFKKRVKTVLNSEKDYKYFRDEVFFAPFTPDGLNKDNYSGVNADAFGNYISDIPMRAGEFYANH